MNFLYELLMSLRREDKGPSSPGTPIAHFGKQWKPGTQTKRSFIYGIVWGTHFHVFFSFNSTFRFAILSCFNPLKHSTSLSALSAMFVYIRVPTNNPINARAPSLGPRLSLFSEVSYWENKMYRLKRFTCITSTAEWI